MYSPSELTLAVIKNQNKIIEAMYQVMLAHKNEIDKSGVLLDALGVEIKKQTEAIEEITGGIHYDKR